MKVLVVEDNALTRYTIKSLLIKLGHEVVAEAENGDKAVKYFSEFKPDVVFLDLILPVKSGLEALGEIMDLDPQARVVIVTAVEQGDLDDLLHAKNVRAILRKPFSYEEFKAVVKGLGRTEPSSTLEGIAIAAMEKSVEKLSRISVGKWNPGGVRVAQGSMDEIVNSHTVTGSSGFAVYFSVSGECPFTSMIIFKPEEVQTVIRGFLGTPGLPEVNQAEDFLFSELANIILNSVISVMSKKLNRCFMPAAPRCLRGEARFLLQALWDTLDGRERYSAASIHLDLLCGTDTTRSEIIIVIPESLEKALAAAQ